MSEGLQQDLINFLDGYAVDRDVIDSVVSEISDWQDEQEAIEYDDFLEEPAELSEHSTKYNDNAWRDYTVAELGMFVHLLVKRAEHRADIEKKTKDLNDAQNYLRMMQAHITAMRAGTDDS